MLNIVLVEPEIPQNCGNIARTCAATGSRLHLIRPLGFDISEKAVRRAGLDYWPYLNWHLWKNWEEFLEAMKPPRLVFLSSKTTRNYFDLQTQEGEFLVFGNEQHGLPVDFYQRYADSLYTLPMPGEHARCHNLANAAAIALYEALRQHGF